MSGVWLCLGELLELPHFSDEYPHLGDSRLNIRQVRDPQGFVLQEYNRQLSMRVRIITTCTELSP